MPIGARTRGSSCARRRVAPMELAEVTRRKDADEQRAQAECKKKVGHPLFSSGWPRIHLILRYPVFPSEGNPEHFGTNATSIIMVSIAVI